MIDDIQIARDYVLALEVLHLFDLSCLLADLCTGDTVKGLIQAGQEVVWRG